MLSAKRFDRQRQALRVADHTGKSILGQGWGAPLAANDPATSNFNGCYS